MKHDPEKTAGAARFIVQRKDEKQGQKISFNARFYGKFLVRFDRN